MPFDAGTLVATLRGDRTQLTRDLTAARDDFTRTGKVADLMGAAGVAAGTKSAEGARKASAAAKEQAASTKAAGAASTEAGAKGARAGKQTADGAAAARKELENTRSSVHSLGVGLTAYGAAAAGAFALAVKTSADYGAKMAQLQTLSQANAADMKRESEAAMTLGTAYGFGASQVADAEIELQKAGQGVTDQLNGGLKGALTLAASGQLEVADATSIAVTTLTQFRLGADKTTHVADLLAAGSDKALGSVKDLGDGLKQGGLVASQMGLSVEDTVGTLSAFAQAGLIGSDAGTSFKTMLLSLQSPSAQAQKYLEKYNITAYDAQGNFVGITNLAGQLQDKLSGVSQAQRDAALSTIFGTDAIRAANVLYQQGDKGLSKWIADVNDSGFAARQAQGKLNSLNGDFTKLVAILQTDLIKAGAALDPVLRPIVGVLTAAATAAGALPPPVLGIGVAVVGLTGAVALGTGALVLFLPRLLEFQRISRQVGAADIPVLSKAVRGTTTAVSGFRGAARSAASFLGGPWGLALAAAGAAMAIYNKSVDDASASTESISAVAKKGSRDVDDLLKIAARGQNQAQVFNKILDFNAGGDTESVVLKQFSSLIDKISGFQGDPIATFFGESTETQTLENTLAKVGDSLTTLAQSDAPAAAQSFVALAAKTDGSARSIQTLLGLTKSYTDGLEASAIASGALTGKEDEATRASKLYAYAQQLAASAGHEAADGSKATAGAVGDVEQAAADAKHAVDELVSSIKDLDGGQLDARSAARQFQEAIDDASAALKENGRTATKHGTQLDISTEAGRKNADALDAIAQTGLDAASSYVAAGGGAAGASRRIEDARKAFVKAAGPDGMGLTKKAAEDLASTLLGFPGEIPVDIHVTASGILQTQAALDSIRSPKFNGTGPLLTKAAGGSITGGVPGRDSVPILAMPGEHVLTVADVGAMGGQGGVYSFRRALHGYAKGGAIGDASSKQAAADASVAKLDAQIARQIKTLKTAKAKAAKAEKDATRAADTSASISGKGTAAKKHAAAMDARDARKRKDAADKAERSAEDRLAKLRDQLDTAKQTSADQASRAQALEQDKQDLAVSNVRGQYVDPSNPLGAVDLAISTSRNQNLTAAQRRNLNSTAITQNANLTALGKRATDAAKGVDDATSALDNSKQAYAQALDAYRHQKTAVEAGTDAVNDATTAQQNAKGALESLRSSFDSVVSSIGQSVRSVFSLSNAVIAETTTQTSLSHNAGTGAQWDEMISTTTPGGTTVAGIRAQIDQSASSIGSFAGQLQGLANMGYSSDVVTDVANLGVVDGSKVAAALLTAASGDVQAINSGYRSIAAGAAAAGTTVAQGQLGGQLSAAQAAVDTANRQLDTANQQLRQAQDADLAQLAATQAAAQRAYDTAVSVQNSINGQIVTAQQAIVTAVQNALGSRRAYGGITGHQPQIQPAGANVLWAEGDTGGEAYIPFAMDRRPRALAILDETARRLGRTVIPAGTAQFALGGITGTSTSYGGDTHNWNGPMFGTPDQIITAAQRNAAAKKARANTANRIGRVNP